MQRLFLGLGMLCSALLLIPTLIAAAAENEIDFTEASGEITETVCVDAPLLYVPGDGCLEIHKTGNEFYGFTMDIRGMFYLQAIRFNRGTVEVKITNMFLDEYDVWNDIFCRDDLVIVSDDLVRGGMDGVNIFYDSMFGWWATKVRVWIAIHRQMPD